MLTERAVGDDPRVVCGMSDHLILSLQQIRALVLDSGRRRLLRMQAGVAMADPHGISGPPGSC
ncbi:hypothetical protein [Micromonospora aurantiaca (nom. illeg.)]|uniref:hypothetical protein n=1 Tax=Micromonospora aurantiaca (nom. illeg.) TaxID=47850 RepID=UPI000B85AF23|nr:hypothetical protein [Micromonospora aurantiaca]